MATRTSQQTGNWSAGSTWVGGTPPGNGDVANIADGHTVTVDQNTTVGTSGTSTVSAITLNNTGQIVISGGVTLTARGNIYYTSGGSNLTTVVTMNAGSVLEFDASAASSPSTTHYNFTGSGNGQYRPFIINGISGSHCAVRSNAGGGNGGFAAQNGDYGFLNIKATYCDFLRIGDASNPAMLGAFYGNSTKTRYDIQNCTFTTCGTISYSGYTDVPGDVTLIHRNNLHTGSLGAFVAEFDIKTTKTGGTREISGNVFDKNLGDGLHSHQDLSVFDNYIVGLVLDIDGAWSYAKFDSNLLIKTDPAAYPTVHGTYTNNIECGAADMINPHWLTHGQYVAAVTITGNIFDPAGANSGDAGDCILSVNGSGATTVTVAYNLVLAGADGRSAGDLLTMFGGMPNTSFSVGHNTVYLDTNGIIDFETGTEVAGTLSYLKSNIVWGISANAANVYKIRDFTTGTTNVASPSNLDYNNAWNANLATNHGYQGTWSPAPAATHDLNVDPQFVDATRRTATWDSAYLGNTATEWSTLAAAYSFSVGDMVSHVASSYYGGATINYRCIQAHARNTANSEPGVGSSWRTYWELASCYRLRTAVAAGTTYAPDSLNGLSTTSGPIETLVSWIKTGFAPTNSALHNAAHDGTDIGAVAYVAASTAYTASISETVTISESAASVFAASAAPNESWTWLESAAASRGMVASVSESITITDSTSAVYAAIQGVSETVTLTESVASVFSAIQGLSESITITEATTAVFNAIVAAPESWAWSDTIAAVMAIAYGVSESVTISESVAARADFTQSLSEAWTWGESVGAVLAAIVATSESLTITEGVTGLLNSSQQNYTASIAESITWTEALSSSAAFAQQLAESVTLSDAVAATQAAIVGIADSLTWSDAVAVSRGVAAGVSESVSWTESVTAASQFLQALNETVSLSESAAVSRAIAVALGESLEWSDEVAAGRAYSEAVSESISITESALASYAANVGLAELVAISNAIATTGTTVIEGYSFRASTSPAFECTVTTSPAFSLSFSTSSEP